MCPHLRLRQLVARGGRRACSRHVSISMIRLVSSCSRARDGQSWVVGTYVALAADHLLAVELGGQSLQGGLNDTTTEAEDQVEGRLL